MKKLLALLLTGIMVFSLAACGEKETVAPTEEAAALVEEGGKSIVMHYGCDADYEDYEAVIYCPEGAYFDEADYADFEEDGYMYTFTVSDDE